MVFTSPPFLLEILFHSPNKRIKAYRKFLHILEITANFCYSKSQSVIILIAIPLTEQTSLAKLSGTMSRSCNIKGLNDQ